MASDASIKRVGELGYYSTHLQGFCDSLVKNGTAFSNLMTQKVEEMNHKLKAAQEILKELRSAELEAERDLASNATAENLGELQQRYAKAHDDAMTARRLLSDLQAKFNVARSTVMYMMEQTKSFQTETKQKIDDGRKLLRNAAMQLQQYEESTRKI